MDETKNTESIPSIETRKLELEEAVDRAFNNPIKLNINIELSGTEEDIKRAREISEQIKDLKGDSLLEFVPVFSDSEVLVTNSHEYRLLLELGYKKMMQEGVLREVDILSHIDSNWEHELDHGIPLVGRTFSGEDGPLKIYYGIRFIRDEEKERMGIQGFMKIDGVVTYEAYQDSVSAPKTSSASDNIKKTSLC